MSTSKVPLISFRYSGFHLSQSFTRRPRAYVDIGFLMMTPS